MTLSPISVAAEATVSEGQRTLTIALFLAFVAITLFITLRASRQTKTAADFYAGGRSFSAAQNGLAIGGDYMSAASFLGIAGIIALYGYVLVRGFNRIMDSDDLFVVLATGGLLTMFGLQAFINMGSALHLLPTKGMTLPFISYGGSSLLSMGMAMGMVLSLTRRQARSGIARGGLSVRPVGGN